MASYTYNTVPFREAGLLAVVAELFENFITRNTSKNTWRHRSTEFLSFAARSNECCVYRSWNRSVRQRTKDF
jgi:hypothetical protein